MKTQTLFVIALCAFLPMSCNFSVGKKSDFQTGLSVSHEGFSIEESYLVGSDNTRKADNKVPVNGTVAIVLEGVENYALKDGKAYPGLMLIVTDVEGNPVIDEKDLLADYDGVSPSDASVLRGTITAGNPMVSGKTYHVKMRVWDKNKLENEIVAELDIAVL